MNPIDNAKYKFLLDFFVQREGDQIVAELLDLDLIESGIIDSLDILELAILIEKNVGVKVDLSNDQTFSAMRRFDSIINLLEE
jgi:acyl carrier protein